jgi:hypothetical protein
MRQWRMRSVLPGAPATVFFANSLAIKRPVANPSGAERSVGWVNVWSAQAWLAHSKDRWPTRQGGNGWCPCPDSLTKVRGTSPPHKRPNEPCRMVAGVTGCRSKPLIRRRRIWFRHFFWGRLPIISISRTVPSLAGDATDKTYWNDELKHRTFSARPWAHGCAPKLFGSEALAWAHGCAPLRMNPATGRDGDKTAINP